jgi:hypothetical protein
MWLPQLTEHSYEGALEAPSKVLSIPSENRDQLFDKER